MPRAARLDAPGVLHHIMIRGIEGREIFLSDGDRGDMISRLGRLLPETRTACFAWALLPNHAHMLLRTGAASLSTLMRRLLTGYVINFNRRYKRQGPLFQNRYKSIVCQEDVYLKELVRYIHLNPLRAGLVRGLEGLKRYRYCGHRALLGEEKKPWQDVENTLGYFGATADRARRAYLDYMKAGLKQGRRDDLTGGGLVRSLGGWMAIKRLGTGRSHIMSDQRILGSSDFVESVLSRADESYEKRYGLERMGFDLDRIAERVGGFYGLDKRQILASGRQRERVEARSVLCFWAVREAGISVREVAARLNMSPPGVGYAVDRGEVIVQKHGYDLLE